MPPASGGTTSSGASTTGGTSPTPLPVCPFAGGTTGVGHNPNFPITPTGETQASLQCAAFNFYNAFKAKYVKTGAPCAANETYVDSLGGALPSGTLTDAEATGFGMLTVVLMAPLDANAHGLFDGMVRFMQNRPVSTGLTLMASQVSSAGCAVEPNAHSTVSADINIALALFLADKTWGSAGINYLALARAHALDVYNADQPQISGLIAFGLWELMPTNDPHIGATRLSDYMLAPMRYFQDATSSDPTVPGFYSTALINDAVVFANELETTHNGLVPDILLVSDQTPVPANFLSSPYDGAFDAYAARVPWNFALDALTSASTAEIRSTAQAMVAQLRNLTGDDATKLVNGYNLDGTAYGKTSDVGFTAPIMIAALLDASNQTFLDSAWRSVTTRDINAESYLSNSVKLLTMVQISGLWPTLP